MFRLIIALCFAALLSGCITSKFDPATSRVDTLPDLTGTYDLVVGEAFKDQMTPPPGGTIAVLRREDNHYRLKMIERGKEEEARDEYIYLGGSAENLAIVYSTSDAPEGAIVSGRVLADGTIEVLMATTPKTEPGPATLAAFARHGLKLVKGKYSPELEGVATLPDLADAMWDPAVRDTYRPGAVFVLRPISD